MFMARPKRRLTCGRHMNPHRVVTLVPRSRPTLKSSRFDQANRKYSDIRVPILAIFAFPRDLGPFVNSHPAALAAFQPSEIVAAAEVNAFKVGVPSARVLRIAHASLFRLYHERSRRAT